MDEPTFQPISGTVVPRYAGASTFVRLPELRDTDRCDVRSLGMRFDSGVSFRPGARSGPHAIRERVGNHPLYVSIDIDSLDPAHAPGRAPRRSAASRHVELLMILRGLAGLRLVSADVVEVSPPYDHAELTSLAAATVVYELVCLLASRPAEEG